MEDPRTPVISIAIAPTTEADRVRLGRGLALLIAEDPNLRVRTEQAGHTVVAGAGELHLEIIVSRLRNEFGVEGTFSGPRVLFKETVTRAASGEMKYARQTGGRGQYGHVKIHLFPGERGSGYIFDNATAGGSIPKEFIDPIDRGIHEALARGVSGYPIEDVRIELYDGSYHDVDSSDTAFKMAAAMAVEIAAKNADPILLEPVMRVTVVGPQEFMTEVARDLAGRRSEIESRASDGTTTTVRARVPMAEMIGYAAYLRSRTNGRGAHSIAFDRYEPFRGNRGDDGIAFVRAPLRPAPVLRTSAIAVPEPDA